MITYAVFTMSRKRVRRSAYCDLSIVCGGGRFGAPGVDIGVQVMTETISMQPIAAGGYGVTRFNALRHGLLSRYTVLPWEDAGEYHELVAALVAEHAPQGPTEEHLVEELAGILWRKRRLRLAEAATHRRGLDGTLASYRETVKGLRRFLETEVLPWFDTRKKELANRPLIREQAFGEALDPDKLARLGRYEMVSISAARSNGCSPCCCGPGEGLSTRGMY